MLSRHDRQMVIKRWRSGRLNPICHSRLLWGSCHGGSELNWRPRVLARSRAPSRPNCRHELSTSLLLQLPHFALVTVAARIRHVLWRRTYAPPLLWPPCQRGGEVLPQGWKRDGHRRVAATFWRAVRPQVAVAPAPRGHRVKVGGVVFPRGRQGDGRRRVAASV